jgi:hypothetical protein
MGGIPSRTKTGGDGNRVGNGVLVAVAVGKGVNTIEVASRDLITGTDGETDGEGEATSSGAFTQAVHTNTTIRKANTKEKIKRFMVPSEMKRTDTHLHYTRVSLSFYPGVMNFFDIGPINNVFVGATLVVACFRNYF